MPRDDLEEWADAFFLGDPRFAKRQTFGCPSYYVGKKMFAFLYEDGLGIKLDPDSVRAKVEANPDAYRHFNPGDGVMKNWLIVVRPDARDYDDERPLIEHALDAFMPDARR